MDEILMVISAFGCAMVAGLVIIFFVYHLIDAIADARRRARERRHSSDMPNRYL